MKKLLTGLCVLALLAGCGSNESKKESKTCSIEELGMPFSMQFNATDDVITSVVVSITYTQDMLVDDIDLSSLTDDELNAYGDATLSAQGIEPGNGVEASFSVTDEGLETKVTIDIENASVEALEAFGLSEDDKGMKLSETIEEMEAEGFTCK